MDSGYIKIFRKFFEENELWKEKRVFSKAEAWLDLLVSVRYQKKPEKVLIGMKMLVVHRGESIKSLKTWAKRWGWKSANVWRFFDMLKNRNAIRTQNETVTLRVTLLNYNHYNPMPGETETPFETETERTRNGSETEVKTEEEGKERKEVKNIYGGHVFLTAGQHQKLTMRFGEKMTSDMIESMNLYADQIGPQKFKARYKCHYSTILNWQRMEEKKQNGHNASGKGNQKNGNIYTERDESDPGRGDFNVIED